MNVSVIVPFRTGDPDPRPLLRSLERQNYDGGRTEVFLCAYGDEMPDFPPPANRGVHTLHVASAGPYAARNAAAARAAGDILLFTEPVCRADPGWITGHASRLRDSGAAISVGRVTGYRETHALKLFFAYEDRRDRWVFSSECADYLFGRPKNMAVTRARFLSDGPFAEVLRGADSAFVQKVARTRGCAEIVFSPEAVVQQASIGGIPSCFRDRFSHAYALRRHQSSHAAPVPAEERRRLFRDTVRAQRGGMATAPLLACLLVAGVAVFRAGKWWGGIARSRSA